MCQIFYLRSYEVEACKTQRSDAFGPESFHAFDYLLPGLFCGERSSLFLQQHLLPVTQRLVLEDDPARNDETI